jgi:hypothetical protein
VSDFQRTWAVEADRIEDQLLDEFAQRARATITAPSAVDLFRVVRNGVRRMVEEGRTGSGDVEEAIANLRQFLDEMEDARLRISPEAYHETTVQAAKDRWCPGLWPFC